MPLLTLAASRNAQFPPRTGMLIVTTSKPITQSECPNFIYRCTGQDCCGNGNGPFPVYANPKLMGCYIPVIPGITNPDSDTPAFDGYNCFPTPASIAARAPSPVVAYVAKTMSASASFLATASPVAGHAFVNYGCYQDTVVANLFSTVTDSGLASNLISVDTCVAYCDARGLSFAAVYGTQPNNKCACGDSIKSGATPNNAMESCNQPCIGSAQQNCGGNSGPLVYARSDVAPNKWAQTWSISWSKTVTYSCTGGRKCRISYSLLFRLLSCPSSSPPGHRSLFFKKRLCSISRRVLVVEHFRRYATEIVRVLIAI
jgi:hypothetical protein